LKLDEKFDYIWCNCSHSHTALSRVDIEAALDSSNRFNGFSVAIQTKETVETVKWDFGLPVSPG